MSEEQSPVDEERRNRDRRQRDETFDLFFKYRAMGECTDAQAESTEFSGENN